MSCYRLVVNGELLPGCFAASFPGGVDVQLVYVPEPPALATMFVGMAVLWGLRWVRGLS